MAPHVAVPDEVMLAVAETPEMWPAIIEWRQWFRDARTGRIEIIFHGMGGGVKDMVRYEHSALGKSVELPPEMLPVCPVCRGEVEERDYGNKVYCGGCDKVTTIWEIKAVKAWRTRRPGERPWSPLNGRAH